MKRIYTLLTSLFVLATSASWAQTQTTAITFEPVPSTPTSLKINWTEGTSTSGRIVVIKDALGTFKPTNGTDITTLGANNNFTAATDKDPGSGVVKIVAAISGAGSSVTVSNLAANTTYFVQVYEFTGTGTAPVYLLTTNTTNPRGFSFYTSTSTFNVPNDVTAVRVQAWGGGGGGGGATNSTNGRAGGGGGGGAYNTGVATVTAGATGLAVTVGTGGAAGDGAGAGSNGGNGGSSTFGSVTAVGGNGGETILGAATDRTGNGGAATTTGTFNGGAGGEGTPNGNATGSATGSGGGGGSPGISGNGSNGTAAANTGGAGGTGGGAAGADGGSTGNGTNGTNGNFPGSGGSGGWDKANTADRTGGIGGGGFVILSYNDNTAPIVTSINRQTPASSPANATTVTFQVTFNEPVTNVTFDDFANGGTAGAGTISVTPVSSSVYNVQISGLSSGTVDLNFGANDIVDLSNNAFGGSITSEQTYTLDNVAPTILTAVASPSTGLLKIGDQVVITLTAGGAETGLVAGAGSTINGQAATFNEVGGGTYTFTYTIASTNANWAAGALTFNLVLNDGVNNSTAQTAFTTANTMAGDANAPTNQNTIFPSSRAATPSGTVTIVAGNAADFNFLAPTGTTNFVANGTTITSAAGNATSITAPSSEGDYQLFVVDAAGNYSAASTATLSVFTQASSLTFGAAATPTTQINLNWTGGSGDGRVVVIKTTTAVNGGNYPLVTGFDPAPAAISLALGANNSATDLNAGATGIAQVVFEGNTAGPITVTGLTANTFYTFEVYEYKNNGAARVYLNPAISSNRSTANGTDPTAPATAMTFTSIGANTITVQFTQSAANTGTSSVLVARAGSAVSFVPTDGVSYPSGLDYGAGTEVGTATQGNKVIAYRTDAAAATPITIVGLSPDVVYHFAVYGMNGTAGDGSENYSAGGAAALLGNRNTQPSTLATPTAFTGVGETTMTLNWTNTGDGDRRLVVIRPNNAITASEYPTNYTTYTANSNFNFGSPSSTAIGAGYVVYDGTGNSVAITNLLPGTTYHYAIFEYNNTTSQGAPNQAFLTPGATASQATNVDATLPAANTVGALTPGPASPGSRVVAGYWNSTNTTLTVNVPLSTTDGTLDGGTIQIQVQNTANTGFINVPNSGLYTILTADRVAGFKDVVVAKADLILAVSGAQGYAEGALSGAALDSRLLEVTAVVNDLTGNSRTYTKSTTKLDVDTTPPAITGTVNLYSNAGLGGAGDQNHEVVQFELNEDITLADDANVLSTNTNGAPGFYINATLKTADSKYQSDGIPNVDASFNGKRAIYLESSGNTDGWSTSTALVYTQQSAYPGTGNFVRDAAGNEMGAVNTNLTNGGTSTALGTSTGVAVASPLTNGSTNQVVFAFSLTSTGALNLTSLSIATSVNSVGLLKNFKLFSSTTTDALGSATNLSLTPTVTASSIDFGLPGNTLSIGLTATPRYFYLVADVENYFLSSGPTIQFSLPSGNLTVSTGGRTGGPITGTNYTLQDNTAPSILSITNTVNPIFEGALTQTVTVVYSEPMNTATNPAITASGANWGASTPSGGTNGWFTTTLTNDSYKATIVHNGTQELNATATTSVAALANGTDWGGNKNAAGASSAASFVLDTQKPTATLTATTTATSNKLVNSTNLALTVQVTYSEAMNTGFNPTITLTPANANFTPAAGVWSGGNTIYTRVYTHNGTAEEIPSTVVSANGGKDANGNTQTAPAATSAATNIVIDTQRPIVTSITRNNPQFTNGPTVSYTVVFNEVVSGVNETDFTPVAINGTVSTGTIFPGGVSNPSADNKTFVVVVQGLTGDGDSRLDVVNGTATISDSNGNSFNTTFNTGEIYSIDNTKPTVVSITVDPAVINSYATTVNGVTPSLHGNTVDYIVTFSEKVNNVDPDFLDFSGLKAPNAGSIISIDPGSITPVGGAPATTWRVSALYNNGAGTFELDFNPSSNNTTAPFTSGTGNISVSNGAGQINNAGGTNFPFEINPGYDIYINGNQYVGTVQCCITGAKFNLESPAVVTSGIFNGPFSFDTAPTTVGFGTGSINASTASNIITGTGTSFKNNLKKNDILLTGPSGTYIGTVQSVVSNTSVQITLAGANINYSGSFFVKRPSTTAYTSTISDQAGNIIVPSTFLAGTYYNFSLPQPASPVASINPVPANLSITTNWVDVAGATHYLVMLKNAAGSFPVAGSVNLNDGVYLSDDLTLGANNLIIQNIAKGVQSATFSGLNSGTAYDVIIYPYSLDNNCIVAGDRSAIDYNLSTPATNSTVTTTAFATTLSLSSSVTSTASTFTASNGSPVFTFTINEDGTIPATKALDNAPFKFSNLVIVPGGTNAVDWQGTIAGAQLTNSLNGAVINGVVSSSGTPATSKITFATIPSTNLADFGFVPDDGTKSYTLRIWFNPILPVPDNSVLDFRVGNLVPANITYDNVSNSTASSKLQASGAGSSVESGSNKIDVVATALAFTSQPVPNAGGPNQYVLTNFTGLPVIKAVDANGNVDKDFITPVSITNASGDQMNPGNTTSLSVTPVAGVINFPINFQYTDQVAGPTFNGTLTATGGGINSNSGAGFVACTPITVRYSNLTTITAGTLNNLSINSIANTALAAVPVFDFKVIDDGAAGVGDGADTRISQIVIVQGPTNASTITDWSQVIQGAILSDGTNSLTATGLTSTSITFSGIPNTNGALGHVAEGAAGKKYTLSIYLKVTTAIPLTLDLKNLTFAVNNTASNFVTTTLSSALAPAQSQASTVSQNEIRVYGTQLRFITNLSSPLLPAKDISLQQTTPQLEITDANGNRDLNYSAPGTVSIANNGGISMNPGSANPIFVSPASGLINFPSNQQFLTTSSPLGVTVTIAGPVNEIGGSVTSATQAGVVIQAAQSTRIANGPAAPATISSLATSSGTAVSVFNFDVKDDFGAAPAADDGLPTLISSLTITPTVGGNNQIADWSQAIAGAELWSGATSLAASSITANTIVFNSIPTAPATLGFVPDNSSAPSKSYTLKIYLKTNMAGTQNYPITIDGNQFDFEVLAGNIGLAANSTNIVSGEKASSGVSKNVVDVTATKLNFITTAPVGTPVVGTNSSAFSLLNTNPLSAFPASTFIYTPFSPPLGIEAIDAFGNRDLGFNSAISNFGNDGSLTTANNPVGPFSGGTLALPNNFEFHTGNNATDIKLTIDAGGLTNQLSPNIRVKFDTDSYVYANPTFAAQPFNNIVNQQGTSLASPANASVATMAEFILSDGGAAAFNALPPASNGDGAFTEISGISFNVTGTGVSYINTLALYDNGGNKISSNTTISGGNVSFTFSPSPFQAAKNSTSSFTIRGTFKPTVIDLTTVQFRVSGVTWSGGSQIPNADGGVPGGSQGKVNTIDVIATSLDFTTQPTGIAGLTPSPVGLDPLLTNTAGKVTARDNLGNTDTNFVTDPVGSGGIVLTDGNGKPITPPAGLAFNLGVIDLKGMIYSATGNGKIRVQTKNSAASLPIPTNLDSNNSLSSFQCNPINVINTTVAYDASTTPLVSSPDATGQANLKGGKTGLSIFGLKFSSAGGVGAEPILKKFTMGFKTGTHSSAASAGNQWYYNSNTGVTVFNPATLRVLYNSVDVTSKGGIVTAKSSTTTGEFDLIEVDLTNFSDPPTTVTPSLASNVNIVLQVDVSSTTNGATQTLIPYLVDAGFGSASDGNIIVSNGTATSIASTIGTPNISGALNEIDGIEYNFASASPPKLLADINIYPTTLTRPYTPQPNVDPVNLAGGTKPQITLQFDTNVGVLDDPANGATPTGSIYDRNTNQKVADLYLDVSLASGQKQATVSANGQTINNNAVYGKLVFNVCNIGNPTQPLSTPLIKDHVYYVNIVAGKYDQSLAIKGSGIADLQLNFYGGVTNNFTLYFKTWSNTAPVITDVTSPFSTTSLGTLSANFNELGTVYYLVMPHNASYSSSTFTATQIKTAAVAHVNTTTSVLISQLGVAGKGPFQIFEFPATFSPAQDYDVFMVSENNANPTVNSSVYYFSKVILGTQITDPATSTQLIPSVPIYKICPDSYSTLTQPIVITENSSDSKTALRKADQIVNIQLPTGYEYDTKTIPTILLGPGLNDFTNITAGLGAGTKLHISYSSNTILQIRFSNTGISNYDYISISGLRVIGKRAPLTGTLPSQGDIVWFYGNDALTSAIPSKVPLKLATIGINVPTIVPKFDNTYWKFNHSISPYHTNFPTPLPAPPGVKDNAATYMSQKVNAIPDNYGGIVRLEPNTSSFNITADYLASTFTGSGVSGDILTLSAVPLDAPFNIIMDHTDVNGCAYSISEQYIVYDHTKPISGKLGVTNNLNPATNLPFTQGTMQDIVNPKFTSNGKASPSLPLPTLAEAEKAGYQLLELQADLPINEIALNQASKSSQLISGDLWREKVKLLPTNNFSAGKFVSATWDYAKILNTGVDTVSSTPFTTPSKVIPLRGTFPNVYDYFKQLSPNKIDYYWSGGSLGKIEFTGLYMNSADNSIFVPYRQEVELFVPAVPLIEVQSGTVTFDSTDPNKFPSANNTLQYPGGYKGTVIACELGGDISFIGYPQALGGSSVGKFDIYDYISYNFATNTGTKITTGFTDNNNGTMTLVPSNAGIKNNYNDILITYTYQENNSPAIGVGYLVVRITPNPVAKFTIASTVAAPGKPGAATPVGFCLGNEITFDATPSIIAQPTGSTPANSIASYQWNFGDPNSTTNTASGPAGVADKPLHTYNTSSIYTANLSLTSNWGCSSIPSVTSVPRTIQANNILYAGSKGDITVGEIPIVDFSFIGNCVGDEIIFTDNSSTSGNTTAGTVAKFIWNFGDATPAFAGYNTLNPPPTPPFNFPSTPDGRVDVKHIYTSPNFYPVTLTTITSLGCASSTTKSLAQLPVKSPNQQTEFFEDFVNNGGGWLTLDLNGSAPVSNNNGGISPWTYSGGKWTIPGNYQANKKSALYTACLDLSNVPRPVISFRSNLDLSDGEGVVLQYSKDDKNIQDPAKAWSVLGTTPDETSNPSPGIEWYNKAGLASNPGTGYTNSSNAKGYGWSGKPGRSEPKHKLEDITNPVNPLPNKRVILRFAFSSLNAGGKGFTIDSVRVGSRTRTVLFENFTTTDIGSADNSLNTVLKNEATYITNFTNANINSTQLVNINYHVDFLGKDPFNALNQADQGSRALFYNIKQVPYAFLDGVHNQYNNSSDLFQNWGQGAYDLQTLNLANADFKIAATPTKVTTNNTTKEIEVEVNVTPAKDLPKSTRLFVAVLEDQILQNQLTGTPSITTGETEFNYVLRKMLPNAVGTRYPDGTFKKGVSVRLGPDGKVGAAADKFTWTVNKVFGSKLSVVVFLQDSTKGVYQADLFQNVAIPSDLTTGIEPLSPESVNIYPNPANQEFVIELPNALSVDSNISLVDQMGKTIDGGILPAGRTNKSVGTYDLAAGVYIVQIKTDGGDVVRKKVVIVH